MEQVIIALSLAELNSIAVSAIVADAVIAARGISSERARYFIYEGAKARMYDELNLTAGEYEAAIGQLAEAMKI